MSANQEIEGLVKSALFEGDRAIATLTGATPVDKLDYSVESLKQIDAMLDRAHEINQRARRIFGIVPRAPNGAIDRAIAETEPFRAMILGLGGYVGEVMRKQLSAYRWLRFEEWAADRAKEAAAIGGATLGTAYVLMNGAASCFPLAKVMKYVANGSEDSTHSFAVVMLDMHGRGT